MEAETIIWAQELRATIARARAAQRRAQENRSTAREVRDQSERAWTLHQRRRGRSLSAMWAAAADDVVEVEAKRNQVMHGSGYTPER